MVIIIVCCPSGDEEYTYTIKLSDLNTVMVQFRRELLSFRTM